MNNDEVERLEQQLRDEAARYGVSVRALAMHPKWMVVIARIEIHKAYKQAHTTTTGAQPDQGDGPERI